MCCAARPHTRHHAVPLRLAPRSAHASSSKCVCAVDGRHRPDSSTVLVRRPEDDNDIASGDTTFRDFEKLSREPLPGSERGPLRNRLALKRPNPGSFLLTLINRTNDVQWPLRSFEEVDLFLFRGSAHTPRARGPRRQRPAFSIFRSHAPGQLLLVMHPASCARRSSRESIVNIEQS